MLLRACCQDKCFGCTLLGGEERLLLGREAFMLQGFPMCSDEVPESLMHGAVPDHLMHYLAGNAMTVHVILAVTQSAMAALTWKAAKPENPTSAHGELVAASGLFKQLRS